MVRRLLFWTVLLLIYWLISRMSLWYFYGIHALVHGGYVSMQEAIDRVAQMGLIVSVLTGSSWIWASWPSKNSHTRKRMVEYYVEARGNSGFFLGRAPKSL